MKTLTRLIVSSVATRSVFKRFAKLSDEDKAAVVEKVKAKVNGDAEEAPSDAAEETTTEETVEGTGDTPDSVGEAVEEGVEESEEGSADAAPDMQGIVDGLVKEVEVIKSDGQITPAEVLGLVDNIVQMVSVLINSKAPRKSRSASREERIADRIVVAAPATDFEKALKKAIASAIREAKRDGTVSMSLENLMQVVKPPRQSLDGAPRGTNARYYYKEIFEDVARDFRSFVKG